MKQFLIASVIVINLLAQPVIGQEDAADANLAPAITAENIQHWIEELDADQFLDREEATENLVRAGVATVDPLMAALEANQRIERDMRAVYVLKQIALSADPAAEEAARNALSRVASLRPGTASQNAVETLATLGIIREQRALEELTLLGANSDPDPLDPIGGKYILTVGDKWKGKDEDLQRLRLLINLSQLTFVGDKVNDQWLTHIREIRQLRVVSINRAKISDDAIQNLVELPQLITMELKYVPITNASLVHLEKIKGALKLNLYGTQITPAGAAELEKQLGGRVEVDYRLGAFLGISAGQHPLGCMVTDVRPKTAAANAGLMLGDIIVTYNENRVRDFDGLTKLIAMNRPKDEVQIQYVRNVEIRTGIRVKRDDDQLGVTGNDHPAGCEVTEVAQGSIAAYLGVRRGDVIYQVNDQLIGSLQELEQVVQVVKVGEAVTIDFARRVELRTVRVQLGEWE